MKTYVIWYEQDTIRYMQIIKTDDLYKWICETMLKSIERYYNFRYMECETDENFEMLITNAVEKGWIKLVEHKLYYRRKTNENS